MSTNKKSKSPAPISLYLLHCNEIAPVAPALLHLCFRLCLACGSAAPALVQWNPFSLQWNCSFFTTVDLLYCNGSPFYAQTCPVAVAIAMHHNTIHLASLVGTRSQLHRTIRLCRQLRISGLEGLESTKMNKLVRARPVSTIAQSHIPQKPPTPRKVRTNGRQAYVE